MHRRGRDVRRHQRFPVLNQIRSGAPLLTPIDADVSASKALHTNSIEAMLPQSASCQRGGACCRNQRSALPVRGSTMQGVGDCSMTFGQSSGPPATGKQLNELLELLDAAGHSDFRDARGPMGFTQRQAGGKFTRDEADAFIEQLQSELHGDGPPEDSAPPASTRATPPPSKIARRQSTTNSSSTWRSSSPQRTSSNPALEDVSTEDLAAELQHRGWVVLEP